jgi:hypothetical protein
VATGTLAPPDTDALSVFRPTNSSGSIAWAQTWQKPRGARLVLFFALAGGGGGGAGQTNATGNGGGGGGSGASALWLVPAWLLPDIVYVSVGMGGASGASGSPTILSPMPNPGVTGSHDMFIRVGGGAGGNAGSIGGGGGTGGSFTNALWAISSFGNLIGTLGQNGTGAVSQSTGTAQTWGSATTGMTSGGTAGGGSNGTVDHDGGAITAPNVGWEPMTVSLVGGTGAGGRGLDGVAAPLKAAFASFYSCGGTGGASNHAGTGGAGGNGGTGSGGGGGGSGSTGGAASRGGEGLVIVQVL